MPGRRPCRTVDRARGDCHTHLVRILTRLGHIIAILALIVLAYVGLGWTADFWFEGYGDPSDSDSGSVVVLLRLMPMVAGIIVVAYCAGFLVGQRIVACADRRTSMSED